MDIEPISDSSLEETVLDHEERQEALLSSLAKKCAAQQIRIVPCHHQTKEKTSDCPIRFSGKGSSWKNSHIECEIEKKFQTKDGKFEVRTEGSIDNQKNCSAEIGAKINY
jgi:hypothetical protein